jgi:hypothetical protein
LRKLAPIRVACGVNDRVDIAERGPRGVHEFGRRAGLGEIAGAPGDTSAGTLAVRDDRLHTREPCRVSALPVQHQALIRQGQAACDRGSDSGPASGDD